MSAATCNVGINMTSGPAFRLDLGGTVRLAIDPTTSSPDATTFLFGDGTGWKLHFGRRSDTTKFMTIQDNGNVGIGTTTPATLLDLGNGAGSRHLRINGGNLNAGDGALLSIYEAGNIYGAIGNPSVYFGTAFDPSVGVMGYLGLKFYTLNLQRATIDTAGRVGIGTTTPSSLLHTSQAPVNDTSNRVGNYLFLESNNNTGSNIAATHTVLSVEGSTNSGSGWDGQIGLKSTVGPNWGPLTSAYGFYALGRTQLNYHNVGSLYNFYAASPMVVTNSVVSSSYGVYLAKQKAANVTTGYGVYQADAADLNYFAGNVGVGTTGPAAREHVYGPGGQNAFYTNGDPLGEALYLQDSGGAAGNGGQVLFGAVQGVFAGIKGYLQNGTGPAGDLVFQTRSTTGNVVENMRIAWSGNVGIGTASPAARLDVVGNENVSGNVTAGGTISGANVIAKYQDVAEWVATAKSLAPGTVVVVSSDGRNQVAASRKAYDTAVAGVVSARPGILLGEAGEGKSAVATTGRVRVKVDATRAPVRFGDLLVTSDREGYAMRSEPIEVAGVKIHRPGTLLGKALEPLETGQSELLVLLSLQ
jgi:hypothetical protein